MNSPRAVATMTDVLQWNEPPARAAQRVVQTGPAVRQSEAVRVRAAASRAHLFRGGAEDARCASTTAWTALR